MPLPRLAIAACVLPFAVPTLAAAQTDQSRIAELEARVAELESGPELTFGGGTATSVEFYGYLKTDVSVDFGAELGNTTFGLIGIDDSNDDGEYFDATAQQLRLGFRTSSDTDYGELSTRVELDFYGGSGAFGTSDPYTPRIRHAYAELGGFLVGKTWSTFMAVPTYPITVDFQGVAGIAFARQEMVRYSFGSGPVTYAVALEDNNGSSDAPVFVARATYDTEPLFLQAAGIVGEVDNAQGEDALRGINLSASTSVWEGGTLNAAYTFGEGIASYLVFLGDPLTDDGDAIQAQSAYAGLTQTVTEDLTVRAIFGYRSNDEAGPSDDTDTLTSLHLNAQYALTESSSVQVEYFRGTRETFDGDDYDVGRVQAAFRVDF